MRREDRGQSTTTTHRYPGVGGEPHPGIVGVLVLAAQLRLQVRVDELHVPRQLPPGLPPLSVSVELLHLLLLLEVREGGERRGGGTRSSQEVIHGHTVEN